MSYERKQLVKQIYLLLDRNSCGFVPINVLLESFDPSSHPSVMAGDMSHQQCIQQMLSVFGISNTTDEATVSFPQFLDYYKVRTAAPRVCCRV